jgi:subtilisin family serine protease
MRATPSGKLAQSSSRDPHRERNIMTVPSSLPDGQGVGLAVVAGHVYLEFDPPRTRLELAGLLAEANLLLDGPSPATRVRAIAGGVPSTFGWVWARRTTDDDVDDAFLADALAVTGAKYAAPIYTYDVHDDDAADLPGLAPANRVLVITREADTDVGSLLSAIGATYADVRRPTQDRTYLAVDLPPSIDLASVTDAVGRSYDGVVHAALDWLQLGARACGPCAYPIEPNDDYYQNAAQWHFERIGAPCAWSVTTGTTSVVVALIDTGCELDHPELESRLVAVEDRWDTVKLDHVPEDYDGHGTLTAGIVAAETNNVDGVAAITWLGSLMPVRIGEPGLGGGGLIYKLSVSGTVDAIVFARDHGASVILINWDMEFDGAGESLISHWLDTCHKLGIGLVAPVSNWPNVVGDVAFPARHSRVIGVGASDGWDNPWRSAGMETQPGIGCDIVAPGVDIWTTYIDHDVATHRGTSAAAAQVAGALALVMSIGGVTAAKASESLFRSAEKCGDDVYGKAPLVYKYSSNKLRITWNDIMGYGRLDLGRAAESLAPKRGKS